LKNKRYQKTFFL